MNNIWCFDSRDNASQKASYLVIVLFLVLLNTLGFVLITRNVGEGILQSVLWGITNLPPYILLGMVLFRTLSPIFCKDRRRSEQQDVQHSMRHKVVPFRSRLYLGLMTSSMLPLLMTVGVQAYNGQVTLHPAMISFAISLGSLLTLVIGDHIMRRMNHQVDAFSEAVKYLRRGELDRRLPIEEVDGFGQLAQIFNETAKALKEVQDALSVCTIEQLNYQREMEIAHDLQQSFLPKQLPQNQDIDIAGLMRPAREIGGDFYDVMPLSQDRLEVVVGDVAGKGVPAALYMALVRTLLRSYTFQTQTDHKLEMSNASIVQGALSQTNTYLLQHHADDSNFISLFYAIYEPQDHVLTYINAGHNPPLIYNTHNGQSHWLDPTNMVVGLMPNDYVVHDYCLHPNDILVLYSDGVTEAFNCEREMFGADRLSSVVRAHENGTAQEIVNAIAVEVASFTCAPSQMDDLTILVMRCKCT